MIFAWITLGLALAAPIPERSTVISVYDGDTVTLENGDKVRLRWVNTPELRPLEVYAKEARQLAYDMVNGQEVVLKVSPEGRDGYGRILAGLRTSQGDLSLALVKAGFAHVFIIPPEDTDMSELLKAQAEAKKARLGIWAEEGFLGALHLTSFHANAPGADELNVNGEYFRLCNISVAPVDLSTWTIRNAAGTSFAMPNLVVPPGYTVKVAAGMGNHQRDLTRSLEAYLGSEDPIFSNDGDRVELVDPSGRVRDVRYHKGSSR